MDRHESALMARGGVRTLRVPFHWPHIQPRAPEGGVAPVPGSPGADDGIRWGPTDELVSRAAEHGIRVLPFVYGTPDWVAPDPHRPPLDSPEARAAWQSFLAALVGRYGPGGELWREGPLPGADPPPPLLPITAWQIWNEQNSGVFWSPRPSAREYGRLVALASPAIRGADPAAAIVLGGMFGRPTDGRPARRFLERLYERPGIAGAFDAYAAHPYASSIAGVAGQLRRLRGVARGAGDGDTPLWVTEIGWPTRGPEAFRMVKSEQGQKRMLARSYRLILARAERWRVGKLIWYAWRDNDVQRGCVVCRWSGLFDRRLRAKPAWRKLTQFAAGQPYAATSAPGR
jgi:hypothetical protein